MLLLLTVSLLVNHSQSAEVLEPFPEVARPRPTARTPPPPPPPSSRPPMKRTSELPGFVPRKKAMAAPAPTHRFSIKELEQQRIEREQERRVQLAAEMKREAEMKAHEVTSATCCVCYGDYSHEEMTVLGESCARHLQSERGICVDCFTTLLGSEANAKNLLNMTCSNHRHVSELWSADPCDCKLTEKALQRIRDIRPEVEQAERNLNRFREEARIAELTQSATGDQVVAKCGSCDHSWLHTPTDSTRAECPRCDQVQCFRCGVCPGGGFHDGKDCVEYIKSTKCPDAVHCPHCDAPIHKDFGCNEITCQVCHYHFCYLCRQYSEHDFHHHFRQELNADGTRNPCFQKLGY